MPICMLGTDAAVAALTKRLGIHFGMHSKNVVDAAIAQVFPGEVDPSGNVIGIGTLGTGTVDPVVGLAVQKSGRTTGATHGVIAAVEVSILVTYEKQCGVGSQSAVFLHQIR